MHPKVILASRYIKFIDSLRSSHKLSVKFLVDLVKDDNRTLTGKTLSRICAETNLVRSNLVAADIKKNMVYFPVPAGQEWRVDMIKEILHVRNGDLLLENFEHEERKAMLKHLCTT